MFTRGEQTQLSSPIMLSLRYFKDVKDDKVLCIHLASQFSQLWVLS